MSSKDLKMRSDSQFWRMNRPHILSAVELGGNGRTICRLVS
jgi:hypothetical protein